MIAPARSDNILMFNAIREWFANRHKLPETQVAIFRSEGLLAIDECIKARLTYRNFKAPGKRFLYKTVWFRSTLVVTKTRVFATAYSKLAIDVPFADERFQQMHFSVDDGAMLLVSFDASLFQPKWSGTLEYRFKADNAQKVLDAINSQIS